LETLHRWSKFIEEIRLEEWENRFVAEGIFYVLEKTVSRSRWLISVYTASREDAETLLSRFGGSIESLSPAQWQPAPGSGEAMLLRVRDSLVVTGSEDPSVIEGLAQTHPGRLVLSFPPQLAFGTGSHPTTAGCLRFLVDFSKTRQRRPWSVLDLGCGSGILAIAAAKLGAARVVAVENDGMALIYARENAERHGVADRIEFIEGDAIALMEEEAENPYDLIAANLFSDLLEVLFPRFPTHLAPDGELILSGFLASQAGSIAKHAAAAGLPLAATVKRGKWMAGRAPR
jgi:ribosomal protein L11 methyltransferase